MVSVAPQCTACWNRTTEADHACSRCDVILCNTPACAGRNPHHTASPLAPCTKCRKYVCVVCGPLCDDHLFGGLSDGDAVTQTVLMKGVATSRRFRIREQTLAGASIGRGVMYIGEEMIPTGARVLCFKGLDKQKHRYTAFDVERWGELVPDGPRTQGWVRQYMIQVKAGLTLVPKEASRDRIRNPAFLVNGRNNKKDCNVFLKTHSTAGDTEVHMVAMKPIRHNTALWAYYGEGVLPIMLQVEQQLV